jgi:hypothetical protein
MKAAAANAVVKTKGNERESVEPNSRELESILESRMIPV